MRSLQQMNRMFRRYNNLRVFATQEQTISVGLGGRGANPVQFVLQNLNFEKLKEKIPLFMEEVRKNPTFINPDINLKFNQPELQITIDRLNRAVSGRFRGGHCRATRRLRAPSIVRRSRGVCLRGFRHLARVVAGMRHHPHLRIPELRSVLIRLMSAAPRGVAANSRSSTMSEGRCSRIA